LGLLVLFSIAPALRAIESDTNVVIAQGVLRSNAVDLSFGASIDFALPEEFGAAVEDLDEILRADIHQRTGADQAMLGPKFLVKVVRGRHPSISPPLLV
jgi:hypothetical protein